MSGVSLLAKMALSACVWASTVSGIRSDLVVLRLPFNSGRFERFECLGSGGHKPQGFGHHRG